MIMLYVVELYLHYYSSVLGILEICIKDKKIIMITTFEINGPSPQYSLRKFRVVEPAFL